MDALRYMVQDHKKKKLVSNEKVRILVVFSAIVLATLSLISIPLQGQRAFAHHIMTEIPVGTGPLQMSLDNSSNTLYVANVGQPFVSVIDTSAGKTIGTINTTAGISTLYAVPQQGKLYVAIFGQPRLEVYNLTTLNFIRNVTLPDAVLDYWFSPLDNYEKHVIMPTGGSSMDFDPTTGLLYVAIYGHDHIEVIATNVDHAIKRIDLPAHPSSIKVDPAAQMVLVTSTAGNRLTFISTKTNEVIGDMVTGNAPWDLALDTSTHTAYVTHMASNYVAAISLATREVIAKIPVAGEGQAISVDSSEHMVYFTTLNGQSIVKVDGQTNQVQTTIAMDGVPTYLLANPTTHQVYASMSLNDKVVVIGPNAFSATFPVVTTDSPSAVVGTVDMHGQDVIPSQPTLSIANKTLAIFVESQDGGNLTLVLPRQLLDSLQQNGTGGDSQFQVTINGKPSSYQEGQTIIAQDGTQTRVLNVLVPKGDSNLQVIGTQVVPEFGPVAMLILTIALVSVMLYTGRSFHIGGKG